MKEFSPYEFVEKFGTAFSKFLGLNQDISDLAYHADKADQYKRVFNNHGLSTNEGTLVYLLSYVEPYSANVRATKDGFVSIENWLNEICWKKDIENALKLVRKYYYSLDLVKFSDKFLECLEKGDYSPLLDFKDEFPKLVSENFYTESVFDSSEYGSSYYKYNIKNNGSVLDGFSISFDHGTPTTSIDGKYKPLYPPFSFKLNLEEAFGGYIIDSSCDSFDLLQFIAYKFKVGIGFIEAYLTNSFVDVDALLYRDDKPYVLYLDVSNKTVIFTCLKEVIFKGLKFIKTDKEKFDIIKELTKD